MVGLLACFMMRLKKTDFFRIAKIAKVGDFTLVDSRYVVYT
jgi:hypothetical protein